MEKLTPLRQENARGNSAHRISPVLRMTNRAMIIIDSNMLPII